MQDAPAKRWPSLAIDPMLPALHPARDGQTIFVNKCFTCHTMNQAGSASVGPDLNLPMNPTEHVMEIGVGLDVVKLAAFNQRTQYGPSMAAPIAAGKEMILATERNHPFILPMSGRS